MKPGLCRALFHNLNYDVNIHLLIAMEKVTNNEQCSQKFFKAIQNLFFLIKFQNRSNIESLRPKLNAINAAGLDLPFFIRFTSIQGKKVFQIVANFK